MFEDAFSFESFKGTKWTAPYRLRLPENYSIEKKYPVVLYYHAAGERGDDNVMQLAIGLPVAMQDPKSPLYNAIIIAPQCPTEKKWVDTDWTQGGYSVDNTPETIYLETALELLDYILKKYSCDKSRIYTMGISMGAFAVWDTLARCGERFAGAFACCGAGDPSKASRMRDIPIWAYHGALDAEVPVDGTRNMVRAIQAAGGNKIHYTEYPELGHWSWDTAYSSYDDIRAMFQEVKK